MESEALAVLARPEVRVGGVVVAMAAIATQILMSLGFRKTDLGLNPALYQIHIGIVSIWDSTMKIMF
jgi:hypothetical protein